MLNEHLRGNDIDSVNCIKPEVNQNFVNAIQPMRRKFFVIRLLLRYKKVVTGKPCGFMFFHVILTTVILAWHPVLEPPPPFVMS